MFEGFVGRYGFAPEIFSESFGPLIESVMASMFVTIFN